MELYILDDLLRRTTLFDIYESLIWTERYNTAGDFELVIASTSDTRRVFAPNTLLGINRSNRVMKIETIQNKVDDSGRALLTVKGPSLEDMLADRGARPSLDNLTTTEKWDVGPDVPAAVARLIFKRVCVDGAISAADIIPFYTAGSLYPAETIIEPDDQIMVSLGIDSVYSALVSICQAYNLGFRLYKGPDTSKIYFNVYTGNDRTSGQTTFAPVVFSPSMDNLTNVTELTTISDSKNVAYVYGKNGTRIVYSAGASETTTGFARRVLMVDAGDIDLPAGAELDAALDQRGVQELAKNKLTSAFDGEISKYSSFQYGRDYELGDLVEMRNSDGITNQMRVTEQIFVDDIQGERAYPTLSVDILITPGSWLSWNANEEWDNVHDSEVWDNQ